ncbi:MAG: N-acetylmuramoyl-L-alanine amidase [Chitinophagaceae bacterium]
MNSPFSDYTRAEEPGVDNYSFKNDPFDRFSPFVDDWINIGNVIGKATTPSITSQGHTSWAKEALGILSGVQLSNNDTLDVATRQAIIDFQKLNSIPESGNIDYVTERTLLEAAALRKAKGTARESAVNNIIALAEQRIEDWTIQGDTGRKQRKESPALVTTTFRDPRRLFAFVLHHMAAKHWNKKTKKYSDPELYMRVGAHFYIMFDGRIIQAHPVSRLIFHAQKLSYLSVAVEFEGNFPNDRYGWWPVDAGPDKKDFPTRSQFESGQFLAKYLQIILGTRSIYAHRQSSRSKSDDPGPDIWFNVGQWAINNLGMSDGGDSYKLGTGQPIPASWRTWGDKTEVHFKRSTTLEYDEYEQDNKVYEQAEPEINNEEPQDHEDYENYEDFEAAEIENYIPPAPVQGHLAWAKSSLNTLMGLSLTIDNTLDSATKLALNNYQSKNGLQQTGRIDPLTERSLLESVARQRDKGTWSETDTNTILNSAKYAIKDFTTFGLDGVKDKPKHILVEFRDPRRLFAFVLHQMAFKRKGKTTGVYSDPTAYTRTGAHFCIMLDGTIIQLHPLSRMIWHGNLLSGLSVAVEFEGNFPDINGKWWIDTKSTVQNKDAPTQAQFMSGQYLTRYLQKVLPLTKIFAHRQSSASRTNDPGPDIWYNVGQYAINNLGLSDGGSAYKIGDGNPILPAWRSWGTRMPASLPEVTDEEGVTAEEDYYNQYEDDEEDYTPDQEQLVKDIPAAIGLNGEYAIDLDWNRFLDEIYQLILPYSGSATLPISAEEFVNAVAGWQTANGIAPKYSDGIIGPGTWKLMYNKIAGKIISTVSGSFENPPASWSSDKVPPGFTRGSYKSYEGVAKVFYKRVDAAAKELNNNAVLSKLGISEKEIDTFQRISMPETGGNIQKFYAYDMAIVSMGFRQFTIIHKYIQDWINMVPAAFKKYGIELDHTATPYDELIAGNRYTFTRIKGVTDPQDLRWGGWAQRFYYAGLDHQVILAGMVMAKQYFTKELLAIKTYLKDRNKFNTFKNHYNTLGHLRGFFHELNNAAPSWMPAIVQRALGSYVPESGAEGFIKELYKKAEEKFQAKWPGNPDKVKRIYEKTASGSRIRVFDQESFTDNEPEMESPEPEHPEDLVSDMCPADEREHPEDLVSDMSRADEREHPEELVSDMSGTVEREHREELVSNMNGR